MKEKMEKDERFIIRTYEKAELAHLYNPNMPLVSAMRKLRAWIRRNRQLTDALTATGENKRKVYPDTMRKRSDLRMCLWHSILVRF